MNFLVLGLNHKSAPLEIRERISFSSDRVVDALGVLKTYPFIEECLILSTCNRVELYVLTEDSCAALISLKEFIHIYHNLKDSLQEYFYFYQNKEALRHIFKVAASLDSMLVGENQILQQVKNAYIRTQQAHSAGKFLSVIFQEALRVGKRVHTETDISKGAVSIGSAAVELAKERLKDLKGKKILIIGAGKIGELAVRSLTHQGIKLILLANRTYEKAVKLAQDFKGQAIKFDELTKALQEVDLVISSTNAPHYILKFKDLIPIMRARLNRDLLLIDLGVPKNIEQSILNIPNVYLYNIDDLKNISQKNLEKRMKEVFLAEEIVKEESKRIYSKIADIFSFELAVV